MPTNVAPFEIIPFPLTLYWAPTGEAFPDVDETPAGNWTKIGTAGDRNYGEGVAIVHNQTIERFRPVGATGPVKIQRTEESLIIRATVWDLTLEQYRLGLNNNTVATTAAGSGTPGFKEVDLYRGLGVTTFALLARGAFSAYGDGWNVQYEVPVVFEAGSPEVMFTKGTPAGLALEFEALEDPNAATEADRFGRTVMQNATAL